MTSTLSPHNTGDIRLGDGTRDLTYLIQRPVRRPDATGEQPIYQPATIGIMPGAAGLADVDTEILVRAVEPSRIISDELLTLPVDATPAPPPLAPGHGRHALNERVGLYPVVRPTVPLQSGVRAERRAAARRERRARVASVSLLALLAAVVLALAVSGVVR